jgi:predicted unusual protein kinase regulating ubiquinone biosynthesis (AarF/ABC1/UbiB family)
VYCHHIPLLTLDCLSFFVLAVLDWGMVTELDPKLRLTLIEHMAHLTSADYAEIPRDLLQLGFIPQSKADLIADSGVVELLADIYGAWTKGK